MNTAIMKYIVTSFMSWAMKKAAKQVASDVIHVIADKATSKKKVALTEMKVEVDNKIKEEDE